MDQIVLVILLILGVPFFVGIWLIIRAVTSRNQIEELTRRVDELHLELARLKDSTAAKPKTTEEKISGFTPAPSAGRKSGPETVPAAPPPIPAEKAPDVPAFKPEMPPAFKPAPAVLPPVKAPPRPVEPTFIPPIPP